MNLDALGALDAASRPHEADAQHRSAVAGHGQDATAPDFLNALLGALGMPVDGATVEPTADQEGVDAEAPAEEAGSADAAESAGAAAGRVDRDVSRLSPAFRTRLDRVMARMREEYGHDVRMVEGFRGQARQDALYEQGRTQPGPVVTWTRASAHTDGRAADLLIDGDYDNPEGYARLAQVAREEGLRTLGPRDAGHIELPADAMAEAVAERAGDIRGAAGGGAGPSGTGGALATSRLAGVATPAEVARPHLARIAPVAQVAVPGTHAVGRAHAGETPADANTASEAEGGELNTLDTESMPHEVVVEERQDDTESDAEPPVTSRIGGATSRDASSAGTAEPYADTATDGVTGAGGTETHARSHGPGGGAATIGGSADAARQLERVLGAQESAAKQPLSRVTLMLDEADGGTGRVRVDLRGVNVDAEIALDDAGSAALLNDRIDELSQALQRQGLDPEILRARATDLMTETGSALRLAGRLAGSETMAPASGSADYGGREDPTDSGHHDDEDPARREAGPNDQRSRKDHNDRGTS